MCEITLPAATACTARLAATVAVFLAAGSSGAAIEPVFPGAHWQTKTPAELGLDRTKLDQFARLAGGRGCVVRYGYLPYTWGDYARASDVASASKVLYSHLMFVAIQEGKLSGVDEKVAKYQPALNELNRRLGYKDREMTFRHLAYQTACLGYEERPGTAFDYNDFTMGFFWDTLVGKVYGIEWRRADAKLFGPKLTDVLRFEDQFTCNGVKPGRPNVSPRDFARFGLLYLNQGKWGDRQVLKAELAKMAVSQPLPLSIPRTRTRKAETCNPRSIGGGGNQCDHNGGYSWLWWLNTPARDGRRWFPDAPPDQFMALGHSGQRGMAVMPKLQLIVSWNDAKEIHTDRELGNRAFRALAEAARWQAEWPARLRPTEE